MQTRGRLSCICAWSALNRRPNRPRFQKARNPRQVGSWLRIDSGRRVWTCASDRFFPGDEQSSGAVKCEIQVRLSDTEPCSHGGPISTRLSLQKRVGASFVICGSRFVLRTHLARAHCHCYFSWHFLEPHPHRFIDALKCDLEAESRSSHHGLMIIFRYIGRLDSLTQVKLTDPLD
jgi:hypothetical protein